MGTPAATLQAYLLRADTLELSGRERSRLRKVMRFCDELPGVAAALYGQRHIGLTVRRKTFAYYLNDHHGDGRICLCAKSTLSRQREQVSKFPDRFHVPAYLGKCGWLSLRLDGPGVDWGEVFELVVSAYRMQAPRKLAEELG